MIMNDFFYKDNKGLICQCLFLGAIIVAGLLVPQLNYIALLMVSVFICMSDRENVLCILTFLVSFAPIFKVNIGGFTFFNLVVVIGILRGCVLSKFQLRKNNFLIFALLAIYVVMTSSRNGYFEVISFLCYLFLVGVLFIPGTISMHKLVTFAIWGIIITSIVALNKNYFPRLGPIMNDATIRLSAGNYYNRFAGIDANPNYYTLLISVCIAELLILFIDGRNKKIDFVYAGVLTVFGLLTVSQSFIVTLGISLVITCLLIGRRRNKKAPLTILVLICVAIISVSFLGQSVIDTLIFRYENTTSANSLSEATSGRAGLLQFYLNYLGNNFYVFLFGKGIGAGNLYIGASHNYYIDILYHLGVLGGVLYLSYLYDVFFAGLRTVRKPKVYQYLPFAVFLIRAFAINLIAREQLVFVLMLCSAALLDREDQEEEPLYDSF